MSDGAREEAEDGTSSIPRLMTKWIIDHRVIGVRPISYEGGFRLSEKKAANVDHECW